MKARAMSGDGLDLLNRGRGRPRIDQPKRQITLPLDADAIEAMRARGPGWQVRANEALKKRFQRWSASNARRAGSVSATDP